MLSPPLRATSIAVSIVGRAIALKEVIEKSLILVSQYFIFQQFEQKIIF